jgi:hypothetical protein
MWRAGDGVVGATLKQACSLCSLLENEKGPGLWLLCHLSFSLQRRGRAKAEPRLSDSTAPSWSLPSSHEALNVAWGTFFPSVSSMSRTTDQTNGVIITDFFFENKHTSFPSCCTPSGVKGCMPLLLPEKQGFQGHMSYVSTFCVNENKTWGTRYTAINTLIRNLLRTITAQNYWQNIFSKRNYCGSVGGTS